MVANDLFLNTFVGDIPSPISTELNEVAQEYLKPNQYEAKPVQEIALKNTTPFIAAFTSTSGLILTADIVIYSLQVSMRITGAVKEYDMSAKINNNLVAATYITTDAGNRAESNYFIAIPNYKLSKGDRLDVTLTATAGAGTDAAVIFLGYYI